jgi:hypothetical protein
LQLAALGKLAVLDAPPTPAATPSSIDQTPQATSPSISERCLQDEQEEYGGMCISQEMATPTNGLSADGEEHDSQPTDVLHTHASSQEEGLPDVSAPRSPNSTDVNQGSATNLGLVQQVELEAGGHPYEPAVDETADPAEAGDGTAQDSTSTALNVVQTVQVGEQPLTQEDVLSPPNRNADSESSPTSRKRTSDSSTPEPQPEKPRKRSTADQVQKELLAKATQSIDDTVTIDNIMFVHERLALLRSAGGHADDTSQKEPQQKDTDHRQGLKKLWDCISFHERKDGIRAFNESVWDAFMASTLTKEKHSISGRKRGTCRIRLKCTSTCASPKPLSGTMRFHLKKLLPPEPKQRGNFKMRSRKRSYG